MRKLLIFGIFIFFGLLIPALHPNRVYCEPEFQIDEAHPEAMFTKSPYLSPKIIEELSDWVSDVGDQVVSVNLLESQDSNRFFGEIKTRHPVEPYPYVYVGDEKTKEGDMRPEEFGYEYVGKTKEGVFVLQTFDCTGGTGVFTNLLLLTLTKDKGLEVDWKKGKAQAGKERLLLNKVGEIPLGDRCQPEGLRVEGNKLILGKDIGIFAGQYHQFDKPQTIDIQIKADSTFGESK